MNKKREILFILFLILYKFVSAQEYPALYANVEQKSMNQWVDSIFDSMTFDERIGQLFMITTDPRPAYRTKVLKYIKDLHIGGILFSKGTLENQVAGINTYQQSSRIPLFISFDGEWGLAMRLEDTPLFPRNMMLGAIQDNYLIRLYGEEVGRELNELGVQINFAPTLDVNSNPDNPVIGTRSYGERQQLVVEKGIAYSKGLEYRNVLAVGKHFPGHGDTSDDSHLRLPLINHTRDRLNEVELYPFTRHIREGFAGIMTAHLSVPALDTISALPASLSPEVVSGLLQKELGFKGLVFTDALAMNGASGTKQNVCLQALLAGNDILLNPVNPAAGFAAIKKAVQDGDLSLQIIEEKCLKILRYKYITGLNRYKPVQAKGLKGRINSDYADWLARKLNEEAITLLKNQNNCIPINKLIDKKIAVLSMGGSMHSPFQQTMALYGGFNFFSVAENATEKELSDVFTQLQNYDVIICGIHSTKMAIAPALQSLCAQKEVHLSFFLSPYRLDKYKQCVDSACSVTLGYENTRYAQIAAAEVIMGGLPAKGKLPVTIAGLFDYGAGLQTEKVRLSYQQPEEIGMSTTTLRKIDKIVREGIGAKAFPGCQVLVAGNGVVVYHKSFGFFDYAGTHPVQNTDIYDLASVTKTLATLPAVMKLYDTEKITLQDLLSQYIPELKNTDKSKISVSDALFHQSGLASFLPFYRMLIDSTSYKGPLFSTKRNLTYRTQYDKNTFARSDFKFLPELVSDTLTEKTKKQVAENFYINDTLHSMVVKKIAASPLKQPNHYLYSDLNFILLKEMTENITRQPFDAFLEKEFYARLGANYTMFLPLKKISRKNIAPTENDRFLRNQILIGYPHDEAALVLGGVSGNAGLFSNANDIAKIVQLFLNNGVYGGERYLSEATSQTFTSTKSPLSRRGLGFDKPDKSNASSKLTGRMTPVSAYGHTGFTGTCFWVDPDNKLIYIFLSNRIYPSRTYTQLMERNIRSRIQDVIYEAMK
jgi:beta-glucosidase-like glycosyl hydrolase/CubicO group peptidase (beta-lactamase class C family)